ncbi:reverse transcriptase domain-containing protein [Tanacetum coccineum]
MRQAFASTELPKGEVSEASRWLEGSVSRREDRFHKGGYGADRRRNEGRNMFNHRDGLVPYHAQTPYQAPKDQGFHHPKFNLSSLTKLPKEILASEPQLNLQPPRPMQLPPKKENQDKYCDYHGEKGHYTNDCFQLKRQLEIALESGKLNHLIKDVGQKGRGNTKGRDAGKDKVINMIRSWPNDRKRKSVERDESWMKAPIVFPPLSMEDASDEPLIIEAVMEGYLVHRVYVDQGASVEVMFEHCFENLSLAIRSRLMDTQMDLVGFAGGVVKPLGKIELEVVFRDGGLFRTDGPKIPPGRFLDNTLHGKVPHPKGVATLVTRSAIISECRRLERKKMVEQEVNQSVDQEKEVPERVDLTEQTLVNLAYLDHLGTYCYTKMPFGIKNIGATYQRMNMKLNPKKCSFGVEEGKFLGYMVTSKGIRANPNKTKAIVDMQSPRTLKEMQSLSGKLAALKRFLSRSAEKSLPFFETLKDITKENKDEYRWTESTEKAFQEMKKVIVELPLLTTPVKEETLYVYVAAATEAVSAVLLAERKRDNVRYTTRLRRYFEARPIKVITDQPLKQILNKAQASGKLAKYSVELGAYNIAYEPRSAMKGQVLADFLSEAPVGTPTEEFFRLSAKFLNKDDVERWNLFTDGASNSKGFRVGLVLINPSGVEFTYALRLNFISTDNEAEYEALLPGIHMARKMKVQNIDVKLATIAFDHLTKKVLVEVLTERSTNRKEVGAIVEEEEDNWMTPIVRCLADGVWLIDKEERRALRMKINQYVLQEDEHDSGSPVGKRSGRKGQQEFDGRNQGQVRKGKGRMGRRATQPEIGMPTHQTMMIREDKNEDELRLNMDLLQERREAAAIREAKYKTKMEQYYNQKVRPMSFKPDEYVFRRNKASRVEDQGKLGPKWEGPYRVTEAYHNGSYKLQTMGGKEVPRTWHATNLRKCYV